MTNEGPRPERTIILREDALFQALADEGSRTGGHPTPPAGDEERKPATVMIVDDDPAIRESVRIALPREVMVVGLDDGTDLLEMVEAYQPDILILDVSLPGEDGFSLCRRLRADASSRSLPVLFLTALNEDEGFLKLLEARGDAYLQKPFDAKVLLDHLSRFIDLGA